MFYLPSFYAYEGEIYAVGFVYLHSQVFQRTIETIKFRSRSDSYAKARSLNTFRLHCCSVCKSASRFYCVVNPDDVFRTSTVPQNHHRRSVSLRTT